ncbi:MAG: hypothetical protein ABIL49_07610 [candidate division WOR-3 bacterium]
MLKEIELPYQFEPNKIELSQINIIFGDIEKSLIFYKSPFSHNMPSVVNSIFVSHSEKNVDCYIAYLPIHYRTKPISELNRYLAKLEVAEIIDETEKMLGIIDEHLNPHYQKIKVLAIENIELGLPPKYAQKITKFLVKKCFEFKKQLIFTTDSKSVLSTINTLIKKRKVNKKKIKFFQVLRNKKDNKIYVFERGINNGLIKTT